jgi:cation diffusion facilitator family transporter
VHNVTSETKSSIPPAQREQARVVKRVTWIGLAANLALAGIKLAAGLLGNSQAVVADAVHSLSDCVTDLAILIGVRYWSQPPDAEHPYGHRRIETLVTVFIGLALAGVAIGLSWDAIDALIVGGHTAPGPIALGAAVLSIVIKEVLFHYTKAAGARVDSSALKANAWHHRSDALSSVPAALAVGGAMLDPALAFLDSVGAIAVSLFILLAAWKIVAPALDQLIDRGAPPEVAGEITRVAMSVPGVREVHKVRTRHSGLGLHVDLHALVEDELTVQQAHDIATEIKSRLLEHGPKVLDVVVHVEPFHDHDVSDSGRQ